MSTYYVNKQPQSNGDHEVHVASCKYLPAATNLLYLGEFVACTFAVAKSREFYRQSNGCYYCAYACHTRYRARDQLGPTNAPHRSDVTARDSTAFASTSTRDATRRAPEAWCSSESG